jgi:probable HAF family extracellular repeat protein
MLPRSQIIAALFVLALTITGNALAAQSYEVIDLGFGAMGYGINNNGEAVGEVPCTSGSWAFLYSNGTITNLSTTLAPDGCAAKAINDARQTVGWADINSTQHPVLIDGGTLIDMGSALQGATGVAYDINNASQATGWIQFIGSNINPSAFRWSNGTATSLGALEGGHESWGRGINNHGDVVGSSDCSSGRHAFLYSNGEMTDLGAMPNNANSDATAINDNGQVVGMAETGPNDIGFGETHACTWINGTISDLGTLGGWVSYAYDINQKGQIVGSAAVMSTDMAAFLYDGGKMVDLNTLIDPNSGWTLTEATAINDDGWIVGRGWNNVNGTSAFLLKPVPEPSMLVLMFACAVGIFVRCRLCNWG